MMNENKSRLKYIIISAVAIIAAVAVMLLLIPIERERELAEEYGVLYENSKTDEKSAYIFEHIDEIPEDILWYYYSDYDRYVDFVCGYPEHKNDYENMSFTEEELNSETVPALYMNDFRWGYEKIGGAYVFSSGCMAVSITMANLALRHNGDIDPVKVFEAAVEMDGFGTFGGIDNEIVPQLLENLGFEYVIHDYSPDSEESGEADINAVINALENGSVVMAGTHGETFGSHALIIRSVDENGTMLINDPANPKKTDAVWDFYELQPEIYFIWELS